MLLILKEIYSSMGISTDNKVPQQTMSIERAPFPATTSTAGMSMQMDDPLRPLAFSTSQGLSPAADFIRKT